MNQNSKLLDLVALLKFKTAVSDELHLTAEQTVHVISIIEKAAEHLTRLEIEIEQLRSEELNDKKI